MVPWLANLPLAVVEIRGDPAWLWLIGAVFVFTILLVCLIAYLLLAKRKPGPQGASTWEFNLGGRLPVSKATFDRISNATATAVSKPEVAPEKLARLDGLARTRGTFVKVYRGLMIAVGLVGLGVAVSLFRDATPGNMLGLPAAIVLLLSLGALLSGLIPSRSIVGVEPIDSGLLDRIDVQVTRQQPLTVSLSAWDLQRVTESLRQGLSIADGARLVYPGYDRLDDFGKRALESALEQSVKKARADRSSVVG